MSPHPHPSTYAQTFFKRRDWIPLASQSCELLMRSIPTREIHHHILVAVYTIRLLATPGMSPTTALERVSSPPYSMGSRRWGRWTGGDFRKKFLSSCSRERPWSTKKARKNCMLKVGAGTRMSFLKDYNYLSPTPHTYVGTSLQPVVGKDEVPMSEIQLNM